MATNINTILNWFKTGFKPTQAQFWATWTSFWHKDEQIPQNSISGLENTLNTKAEKAQLDAHLSDKNAHADLFDKKANSIHNHIIDDIEGLENVLNDKALLSHEHEIADIKGLEDQLVAKLTATLATDAETQIDTNVSEDNKVISRSKLLSWWQWIKSKTQTISGSWNFTNGLKAEVSVDLKEPTSQKGISMVKDGLKFWFTEVINSLLKTNPSSTGISTVLMPEMQNGETKTLATLDDLNSSSQDLAKTLSSGNTANNEIFLSDGLSSTILAVGTVGVGDPTGKFVTITPNKLSVTEAFTDRELSITSTDIVHKTEDLSVRHTLNWDESVNGDYTQTFQAKSGEIALLSDITGGSQNLDEILANGDTSDKNIVLSKDGAEMIIRSSNIDLRETGVGRTLITPFSILHANNNGGLLDLRFDETTIENYTQTFQAKSGEIALLSDIVSGSQDLQETLSNGSEGLIDKKVVLGFKSVDETNFSIITLDEANQDFEAGVSLLTSGSFDVTSKRFVFASMNSCGGVSTGSEMMGQDFIISSQNVGLNLEGGAKGITVDGQGGSVVIKGAGQRGIQMESTMSTERIINNTGSILNIDSELELNLNSQTGTTLSVKTEAASISLNANTEPNITLNSNGNTIIKATKYLNINVGVTDVTDGARVNEKHIVRSVNGVDADINGNVVIARTVENFTQIDLTTADLNTAYPNAELGFKVNASSIIGGGFIYEKTSTGWVQYTVTKVP